MHKGFFGGVSLKTISIEKCLRTYCEGGKGVGLPA